MPQFPKVSSDTPELGSAGFGSGLFPLSFGQMSFVLGKFLVFHLGNGLLTCLASMHICAGLSRSKEG